MNALFLAPRWPRRVLAAGAALALALAGTLPARANPFDVAVSPSRFELAEKSGKRMGQSLELFNLAASATELAVRTLDWTYSAEGGVSYSEALLPQSCRTWVTLERHTVKIGAKGKASFRFQIDIPADAPRGECRFMLAVESTQPAFQAQVQGSGASLSLPVNGRIAVAVYLAVNGAEPQLTLTQVATQDIRGQRTPVITVRNTGDAHGRLDGSLDAIDAKGLAFELVPESTPIMPGQTRTLPLGPKVEPAQKPLDITLPIKSSGTLDWEGGSFKVNAEFK